jgi:biopolymer transport protein ExbD
MNFQRGKKHEDLEMNLVPLIDVLLVIIIFLVVSSTFARMSELQINLPTAQANTPEQKPLIVDVGIDAKGHYVVAKSAVSEGTVSALGAALRRAAGDGKEPTIIINADANTTHQSVINVMEAARQVGYTHITFATKTAGNH